jgi:hypothetical protein
MPTRKKSVSSSRNTRKRSAGKHSALGRRIVAGLREGIAHARGEIELRVRYYSIPEEIDSFKSL